MREKYVVRPLVIEAEQWGPAKEVEGVCFCLATPLARQFVESEIQHVHTLAGDLHVSSGDWIITGPIGEKYVCKHAVFVKNYKAVNELTNVS